MNVKLTHTVTGRITDFRNRPLEHLTVRAYDKDPVSPDDYLGEDMTNADGEYTIRFGESQIHAGGRELGGPDLYICVFDGGQQLGHSEVRRNSGVRVTIDLQLDYTPPPVRTAGLVEGRVVMDNGLPASHMTLHLYRLEFGGQEVFIGKTNTGEQGEYTFRYNLPGAMTGLVVRGVDEQGREIPLGEPLYQALSGRETLHLTVPRTVRTQEAEYRRLSRDLTAQLGALSKLSAAKENPKQRDITLLSNATGWDARLIALAASAEKLNLEADAGLPGEAVYGLLRAGLPSDPAMLAEVEPDTVEQTLIKVRHAGIIDMKDEEIAEVKERFRAFANRVRWASPVAGSQSTYDDFLRSAGLDDKTKQVFASLYMEHRGAEHLLWEKAREAGIGEAEIRKLQLQGKLAYLTGYSEKVTSGLMRMELTDPAGLADLNFDKADTWVRVIRSWADDAGLKPEEFIPDTYRGGTAEERLQAYAEDMSRKIRLSCPTQVVKRMIERQEIRLGKEANAETAVKLLDRAAKEGFRLGETPVTRFFQSHAGIAKLFEPGEFEAGLAQLKTIQRVYQITPTNESMTVLLHMGITSAHDVLMYEEGLFAERFVSVHVELFGAPPAHGEERLVYRKATQVSSVTHTVFSVAKKLESDVALHGLSPGPRLREAVRDELVKQFPTMESLFGSLDYCECEHCQSVLSPAAYLVDLLQFIDPEEEAWHHFLADWEAKHGGGKYTDRYKKPIDALLERRPDLAHIPLTCENTNTALPYIDLVNEILEYYVAYGKLEEQAAKDTGGAKTEDLIAEPRHVIREAYDKLLTVKYPLGLPYDRWIDTVRRFLGLSGMSLEQMLAACRTTDDLFAPDEPVDWHRIFMESLGLSPAETALFTDPDPLASWHTLYGYAAPDEAAAALKSAKTLSQRLGLSYKQLIEIVQTGFVNPQLAALKLPLKIGIQVHDARFYQLHQDLLNRDDGSLAAEERQRLLEAEAILAKVQAYAARTGVPVEELLHELDAIPYDRILLLADPDAGCDFSRTIFQYADGSPADAAALLRLNLFVRLWRKLGWSVEETDWALSAFIPKNAPCDAAGFGQRPLQTALIYLAHLKALDGMVKAGSRSRIKLAALWTDRLPLPELSGLPDEMRAEDGAPLLKDHWPDLQGALGLSAEEAAAILKDNGRSWETEELSLASVCLLYRHGLLAGALELSVDELLVLKRLSGLNPFAPLSADPLRTLDEDVPFTQTLRFVETAALLKQSGITVKELAFLFLHRMDEEERLRLSDNGRNLLKAVADGLRGIEREHALPENPGGITDELLRQKLGLVLPREAADRLIAMMNGTAEFTAVKSGVPPEDQLHPDRFRSLPDIREVRYDGARQEQTLVYRGVLSEARRNELLSGLSVPSPLLETLLDDVQEQARAFFREHLQIHADRTPASGLLAETDFELLFSRTPDVGETEQERAEKRRLRLAQAVLPRLKERLLRQLVIQTASAILGGDPALVERLLTDKRASPGARTLMEMLAAGGRTGVSATFYASADGSGSPLAAATAIDADTDAKNESGVPVKPAGADSVRMEGWLEVPETGAYRFFIELDSEGMAGELRLPHLADPVFLSGEALADGCQLGTEPEQFVELKAGVRYRFSLLLTRLSLGGARLTVQGETLPKGRLGRLLLHPAKAVEEAEHAAVLLSKRVRLLQASGLNERETDYVLAHPDSYGGPLLQLPVSETFDEAAVTAGFRRFLRLLAYARLKNRIAGGDGRLIDVFEAARSGGGDNGYALFAELVHADESAVKAAARALLPDPDPSDEGQLERLAEVLECAGRLGVPVSTLIGWTEIASPAAASDRRFAIALGVQAAAKSRFAPEDWRRAAQPVFDQLRQSCRDALAAYVMHQHGFDRMEQLYDYFLIDPGMEPAVRTSRIRLAIASVQLFIQRCLLSLEPEVHPSVIRAKEWEWMKRYRVWEANRKIFLYPENWLEPEFRDDKTHLFRELEGTLLQSDVTADLAEDAFLAYLRKLDELARLLIVAVHLEEREDPALNTLHVIGRTYSQPYQYFYRRYAQRAWTPWEPITAEVEGDHLAPVVWRGRLYLFWVSFMDKPHAEPPAAEESGGKMIDLPVDGVLSAIRTKQVEVQLYWSEYIDGVWSPRESGGFDAAITAVVPYSFRPPAAFIHVSKAYEDGEERGVYIHIGGPINRSFYLAGRNSAPESRRYGSGGVSGPPENPYSAKHKQAARYAGSGSLSVTFEQSVTTEPGKSPKMETAGILKKTGAFTIVPCNNDLIVRGAARQIAALMKPVFFQDDTHTLFLEPAVTERTIEEWQEWVVRKPRPWLEWINTDLLDNHIVPYYPNITVPVPQDDAKTDWLINPRTGLVFDESLVTAGLALETADEVSRVIGASGITLPMSQHMAAVGHVTERLRFEGGNV